MLRFLNSNKAPIVAMVMEADPENILKKMKTAITDGADCIGLQVECIKREYRTEEYYRSVFSETKGIPLYLTSYRDMNNEGFSDKECMNHLLYAAEIAKEYGPVLCDVMGDTFGQEKYQLTHNQGAIEKQKELIKKIHAMGCEVLMSSHFKVFLSEEKVLECARAQIERGTDIVKMITMAEDEIQLVENLKILQTLKKEISVPYVFLSSGHRCQFIREMSVPLGNCMYLTRTYENDCQASVSCVKFIRDNLW